MATAVLPSHVCLKSRLHLDAPPPPAKPLRKRPHARPSSSSSFPSSSLAYRPLPPKAGLRQAAKPGRAAVPPCHRRKSRCLRKDGAVPQGEARPRRALRILKRGTELKPFGTKATDWRREGVDSVRCSVDRQRRVGLPDRASPYAGPGFSTAAPSPSSLPFPSFHLRKAGRAAMKGDEATRALVVRVAA